MSAHEQTPQEALDNALRKFSSGASASKGNVSKSSMTLCYTENDNGQTPLFYVYSKTDGGFLIAGADSRSAGLLGYTDNGDFDTAKANPAFKAWLSNCTAALKWLSKQTEKTENASKTATLTTSVSPLLGEIKWDQNAPYNMQCPTLESGDHAPTGCVATATAQVMGYYKWPVTGTGSHTNANGKSTDPNYTVDFSKSTYDWDNIQPTYTGKETGATADAIAKLMADIGCAVDMVYGESSGANTTGILKALTTYFGYDKTARYEERAFYSTDDWNTLLRNELDNSRPIIFGAGTSDGSGHSFVLDGYDTNGLYHVNWGWSGVSNGYFDINYLDPGAQGTGGSSGGNFDLSQEAIVKIQKDAGGVAAPVMRAIGQIIYSSTAEEPFSYTIENAGTADFNGVVGFALLDSNGSLVKEFPVTLSDAISIGQSMTISMGSIPSSVKLEESYVLMPYYRLSSTGDMYEYANTLTAQPYLFYHYFSSEKKWYWLNTYYVDKTPANLTCSKCEITRSYTGYAPKFSLTVKNDGESTLEYNAPIYVYITKTVNDKDTVYCFGSTQLFLDPGETKTIDVQCNRDYDKSYSDMTDGTYNYLVCCDIGGYPAYYLYDTKGEYVQGTFSMTTPAASNVTYDSFALGSNTVAKGGELTASFNARNVGGFTVCDYRFYIFPIAGKTSVGYLSATSVDIPGDSKTTSVTMKSAITLDPGDYVGVFYRKDGSDWTDISLSNPLKFSVTESTGINNVNMKTNDASSVVYDIMGRPVQNMTKGGIYIINGKKVIR